MMRICFLYCLCFLPSFCASAQYSRAKRIYEQCLAYLKEDTLLRKYAYEEADKQGFSPLIKLSEGHDIALFAYALMVDRPCSYLEKRSKESLEKETRVVDSLMRVESQAYQAKQIVYNSGKKRKKMEKRLAKNFASKPRNMLVEFSDIIALHNAPLSASIVVKIYGLPAYFPQTNTAYNAPYNYLVGAHPLMYWLVFEEGEIKKKYVYYAH